MTGTAEILTAIRELSNLKGLDRTELHGLLQDGIHAALAKKHGAIDYVNTIADDVKPGKVTSFPRAVDLKPGEVVVCFELDYLDTFAEENKEAYLKFYKEFGSTLREGITSDFENRDR